MNNIKVSIIIPVYNVSLYLRQCLNSIMGQTLKEIEIICINDGSTDDSLRILEECAVNDNRIVIINQENKKQGAARNVALEIAKGEYIGFVDSDDWIEKTMYEELYCKAQEKDSDIVLSELCIFYNNKCRAKRTKSLDILSERFDDISFNYKDTKDYLFEMSMSPCDKLYKTKFLRDIDAKFTENLYFEDVIFWATTYLSANKISILRKPFYYYRKHIYSTTKSRNEKYFDIINIIDLLEGKLNDFKLLDDLRPQFINFKIRTLVSYLKQIDKAHKTKFYKLIKQNIENMDGNFYNPEVLKSGKCYLRHMLIKMFDNYCVFNFFDLITRLFYVKQVGNHRFLKCIFKIKINDLFTAKIPFFYYKDEFNFGDALNVELLSKVLNVDVKYAKPKSAKLVAIGSILEFFLSKKNRLKSESELTIWGTGLIKPIEPLEYFNRKLNILALRGILTKTDIEAKLNKSLDNVVLGDPGLLASYLIDKNKIEKKYKLGIIPHYVDKDHSSLSKQLKNIKGSRIIDIQNDPYVILQEIAECEVIISSSLHGLIAADSLGIPNRWAVFSGKLKGGEYKFRDYYSIYENMSDVKPIDFNLVILNESDINDIKANYTVSKLKVAEVQKSLIAAYKNKFE